jgi:hypothetical protein
MDKSPLRLLLNKIIRDNKFPTSVKSNDVKADQRLLHKMLKVSNNKEIGISTEKDRGLLWFWRR